MVGVDVQIAAAFGKQRAYPSDFPAIFGQMGVQVHAGMFAQQASGQVQLFVAAAAGKARRHRVAETASAMPALDQRLALFVAAGRGVAQRRRGVAVHQHLAAEHAQIQLGSHSEEGVHRLGMHGGKHQRAGGAVAQQLGDEDARHLLGVVAVGEAQLGRVGVAA
ncbi:hypothetical protein D3C75_842010 [compost metagenome]